MGRAKKVGSSHATSPNVNSKSTSSSKISKVNKVKDLGIFGSKKIQQEKGIDLDSCVNSYIHKVISDRKWNS